MLLLLLLLVITFVDVVDIIVLPTFIRSSTIAWKTN
jgi:hypothetical protein